MIDDYSSSLIALKQAIKSLEDALLHRKMEKIPTILRSIEIERDLMDFWYWKQQNIDK